MLVEGGGQRDAPRHELGADAEQAGARGDEPVAVALAFVGRDEQAHLDGPFEQPGVVGDLREELEDAVTGDVLGLLVAPRGGEGLLEAEDLGEAAALLPAPEELLDGGQREAALLEAVDVVEAGQVALVVVADSADHPGRGEEAAGLMGPDVAGGGPGPPGQLVDGHVRDRHRCSS